MVWTVSSTAGPTWQVGSAAGISLYTAYGAVTDFPESVAATASVEPADTIWSAGTTDGGNWQAGTTYASIVFGLWQYTPYRAGEPCELGVVGADGAYQIIWSPTDNPLHVDAVVLTVTGATLDIDGNGTVIVTAQRTTVRYGQQGWLFLAQAGEYAGTQVTLFAEPGKQHVVLTDPLVDPELGISAIPDLAAGDMLIWWNALPAGEVTVYPDRSFITDDTVDTFDVEAHIAGSGYTNTEVQDITVATDPIITGTATDFFEIVAGTATYVPTGHAVTASITDYQNTATGTATFSGFSEWVSPVPLATCTGQPLANQTDIRYVILPGHTLHAPTVVVSRTNGTTDAQGIFRALNISYTAGQPVTLLMRWIEGGRDRFVILYTQLTVQG